LRSTNGALELKKRIAAGGLALVGSISIPALAVEPFASDSPWLTGDWSGKRNELSAQGFTFGLFYVNELATNVRGGYDQKTALETSDQTTALFNYDLSKKLGVDGEFSLVVTNRNNHELLTNTRVNDPRTGSLPNLSQEVWGFGSVTRLTRLTYQQNFFDKQLSLRVGKMTPTEEFFPSTCEFQSLVNCGTVPGISNIWYGWPISTWAATTTWHMAPDWYVKFGVYQQNPQTTRNDRAISLSDRGTEGQIYPVLLGWRPYWGERKLAGNYFIGAYYSNVDAPDVAAGAAGGMEASNPSAGFKTRHSKRAAWAFFEQQLTGPGGDSKQGLRAFVNAEINDKETSVLHYGYGAGLYYNGLFANRPDDMLGFASTAIKINKDWTRNRDLTNQLAGVDDYDDPRYLPLGDTEVSTELFYRYQATRWLYLQPNIQYYHAPGGVDKVPDATVLGLRFNISF